MVSRTAKIAVPFFVLGIALWIGSMQVTENQTVQYAVLFGVAVIIPTLLINLGN